MWNQSMSNNDYNDFGNQNAGGFMADDANATSNKPEGREKNVIVSVNVNQLCQLTTAQGLILHRQKINLIRLVGRVVSINDQSTKATYTISDGTAGTIEASFFKHNEHSSNQEILMENSYVRVIGVPRRNASGEPYVMALSVNQIDSLNEYAVHWLEVLDHSAYFKKQKVRLEHGYKPDMDVMMTGGVCDNDKSVGAFGLDDSQKLVLKVIHDSKDDSGIIRQEIYDSIKTVSPSKIDSILLFLLSEGHIFTTISDDHFKTTND